MLQDRRRALHARIVAAIERLYPDRRGEQVERLAHHPLQGELWDKAVAYLRQAGQKAAAHSAHREAVVYVEQALAALGQLPDTRATRDLAIDLRFALRDALGHLQLVARVGEVLREAEALAEALGDQRRLARVCVFLSAYFRQIGDHRRGREVGQRALALASALGDRPLLVEAQVYVGLTCHNLGEYDAALSCFKQTVASLVDDWLHYRTGTGSPAIVARSWVAICLAERGQFANAIAPAAAALELAGGPNVPWDVIIAFIVRSDMCTFSKGILRGPTPRSSGVSESSRRRTSLIISPRSRPA